MFYTDLIGKSRVFAMVIAVSAILSTAGAATAHVRQTVGQYTIYVGFKIEPTIVEQPNGVDVLVRQGEGEDSPPVSGLGSSLKADIKFGDQSSTVELAELDGSPGEYVGNFIPTSQGPYTFRIYGTINGTNVDQSFTSGPQTFSEVESAESLQFPVQVPPVASVNTAANDASSAADSAQTLAIVGIVVGGLGLIAGAGGMIMARRARSNSATPDSTGIDDDDLTGSAVRP